MYNEDYTLKDPTQLKALVTRDIEKLDGFVIPGDIYNMPAIKESDNPYQALLHYDGTPKNSDAKTVYTLNGRNLTEQEFNKEYPRHYLNPDPSIIHYEAEMLKQIDDKDIPVMCSCHGAQMFALMRGANMVAGLEGHDGFVVQTKVSNDSMAKGYLAEEPYSEFRDKAVSDDKSLSVHTLAIDPNKPGDGLVVVGVSEDGISKILEDKDKPHFIYQSHPEKTHGIHSAIEAFSGSAIQHKIKKTVEAEITSNKH